MSQTRTPTVFHLALLYAAAASMVAGAPSLSSRATNSTAPTAVTSFAPLGSGTDVFREGAACRASWIPDTTGAATWKSMTIQLMTGSNLQMTALGTVASGIDGTNPSVTVFNYACPEVSPNAAIYFLQYTHDGGEDPTWTTRFAIGDEDGKTVAPPESNQPQGGSPAIPWGQGTLVAVSNAAAATTSTAVASTTSKVATSTRSATLAATSTGESFSQQRKQLANAFSSAFAGSSASSSGSDYASSSSRASSVGSHTLAVAVFAVFVAVLL